MDSDAASGTTAPPPNPPGLPDLRTEVLGTVLLFVLTVLVTAGVALCASVLIAAFG